MEKVKGVVPSKERLDGSRLKIAIVSTRWNIKVIDALKNGAVHELTQNLKVKAENIDIYEVPGAFELPHAAKRIIDSKKYDSIITIGCLIKGETFHFDCIALSVAQALQKLNCEYSTPVIFGVLTCLTDEQALARCGLKEGSGIHNHGVDWAQAAVEMALLPEKLNR